MATGLAPGAQGDVPGRQVLCGSLPHHPCGCQFTERPHDLFCACTRERGHLVPSPKDVSPDGHDLLHLSYFLVDPCPSTITLGVRA